MARALVNIENLEVLASELELAAKRLREAAAEAKSAKVPSILMHWILVNDKHVPAITKMARDALITVGDAVRASKTGTTTTAEQYKKAVQARKKKAAK